MIFEVSLMLEQQVSSKSPLKDLSPHYFFKLQNYVHYPVFEKCEFVWEVLPKLKNYILSLDLGSISVEVPHQAFIEHPELVSIGEGTIIEPGAFIRGPCVIGKNCQIRHGAYIRGSVLIGDHCVVGHDTEVKNAIFMDYAQAGHFAYLGDSVLGRYVNLGAGTKCANLKLDKTNICLKNNGNNLDSGLRKFGAILGDYSQTGCNSVTNPGTLLGPASQLYPCVNVGGFIPASSLVKPKDRPEIQLMD
jgi:NDP-sugar pyrophosphorylase family protein